MASRYTHVRSSVEDQQFERLFMANEETGV